MMKTGVIDVGGGLRGVYAAGVFDYCMDQKIQFDLGIGVSAGSANVASYIAGQKKRNYAFYTDYPFRREYMSLRNFLFKKSYLDLDYIYGKLSNTGGVGLSGNNEQPHRISGGCYGCQNRSGEIF